MAKKRILNVGCGEDAYGTDFVDLFPSRKEVKKCDVDKQKLPFKKETFDEVYSKCVFEHIKNKGFFLDEMFRVLKKGGKLVIITDNANYWYWSLPGKAHSGGYDGYGNEDTHYSLFTKEHLKRFFDDLGMKNIKITFLEEKAYPQNFFKRSFMKTMNFLLKNSPLKRSAYPRIKIQGKK